MLNESGNLIEEGIPITKELLDFAKANNYKISLKTGDYGKEPLKANRAKNNPVLFEQVCQLYLNRELYPNHYFHIFGLKTAGCFRATLKYFLGERWADSRELYPEEVDRTHRDTNLARYQVDNVSKLPEVSERRKRTNLKRYQVDNAAKSPEAKANTRKTNQKRYQANTPIENPEIKSNIQRTNLKRYKSVSPLGNKDVRSKNNPNLAKVYEFQDILEQGELLDVTAVVEFITENYCASQALIHLKELSIKQPTKYLTEVKLCNLLDSLGIDYIHNAKKAHQVRKPNGEYYELDAYIPTLNLGIEINGRAHHATNFSRYGNPKTKDYHFEKFKAFRDSGILMISFTDYEQDHFRSDYENIIKHHLTGEPLNVSKEFLEFNQISNIEESLNYGLFDPSRFTGNFEDHQHQRFIEDFEYWDCGVIR